MQNVSIREVQHNLAAYIHRVEKGEEIQISKRNRPVAMIVPIQVQRSDKKVDWDAHFQEIRSLFKGRTVKGKPMDKIVADARGEY